MPRNFEYPAELACPHDGWYNGNPKLMIANGAYADYRHRLVEWVRRKKMTQADLDTYDKQWTALSIKVKRERRDKVLEDIKKVPKRQRDGKVEYVSKPSDNGAGNQVDRVPQLRRQLSHRQPLGSLDTRPDPLAAEEMAMQAEAAQERTVVPSEGKGHAIPDAMPPSMVETPMSALAGAVA